MTPEQLLQTFLSRLSLDDLETMRAILRKCLPDVHKLAEAKEQRELEAGGPS